MNTLSRTNEYIEFVRSENHIVQNANCQNSKLQTQIKQWKIELRGQELEINYKENDKISRSCKTINTSSAHIGVHATPVHVRQPLWAEFIRAQKMENVTRSKLTV